MRITYWICNNPKHHHRTEAVAQRCIEHPPRPPASQQHRRLVTALWAYVHSDPAQYAAQWKTSKVRVYQLMRQALRLMKQTYPDMKHMPTDKALDHLRVHTRRVNELRQNLMNQDSASSPS
jgi:hypothetical protein